MGAATLLYEARSEWRGSLVLVFQPERERAGGAQAIIDDGIYTNGDVPLPDVVLGQHLVNVRAGYIAIPADYSLPGKTTVAIKIHGRCGHDVEPHQRIDPAEIAGRIINGVESIICHKISMSKWTSISCGDINPGDATNTNRDEATLRIEIRAYCPDILIQAVESVKRIVQEKCDVYFCPQKPDFKQIEYTPPLINDPIIEEVVIHQFREFFGQMTEEMHENTASRSSHPSEDFPVLAPYGIPYVYWGFGSNDHKWWERLQKYPDPKEHPTKHDSNYAPVIQPTLKSGVDALAIAALTFLTQVNGRGCSK